MSRSLRARLTVAISVILVAVLGAFGFILHAVLERALGRELEARLLDDASAIAGMAEDGGDRAEFEAESLPEFQRDSRPAYFEAWLDDGTVLARSPSLRGRDLARSPGLIGAPSSFNVALPDGRPGRALQLRQPLRIEPPAGSPAPPRSSTRSVTVVVSRGVEDLAETLTGVRRWLTLLGGVSILTAIGAVLAAVSMSLHSTRQLATQIAEISAPSLVFAAPPVPVPSELVPVVEKIEDLLARLRESFARERRFTADVSHELRTPLAALRTMLEVAGSRLRDANDYRGTIAEAGDVVLQMQTLCESLLALARFDAGAMQIRHETVVLRTLIEDAWRPLRIRAGDRGLVFNNEIAPDARLETDPGYFQVIVSNLLSNAVSYTASGGTICALFRGEKGHPVFELNNSGPPLASNVLPHIFERFFRGDAVRSDRFHYGIGLALVQGIGQALALEITAKNTLEGGVSFAVAARAAKST